MIPGSNLLLRALKLIAKQTVSYYQNTGRSVNNIGMFVSSYADPILISGSLQAAPRALLEKYGLDLSKEYVVFFTNNNVLTTDRDVSGDQIIFNGIKYQCESKTNWYNLDGWVELLMVLIPSS